MTKAFRLARRSLPPPGEKLDRAQAAIYRQLQTGTLPSPSLLHKIYSETRLDSRCRVCCRETATLSHMLWNCIEDPTGANSGTLPPLQGAALRSYDQDEQLWAVQQALEVIARQDPEAPTKEKRGLSHKTATRTT